MRGEQVVHFHRMQNCRTAKLQNFRTTELPLLMHQYGHILHAFQ
jgi:hypothetical protein